MGLRHKVYRCGVSEEVETDSVSFLPIIQADGVIEVEGIYTVGTHIYTPSGEDRFTFDVERAKSLWGINPM